MCQNILQINNNQGINLKCTALLLPQDVVSTTQWRIAQYTLRNTAVGDFVMVQML